MRKPLLATLLAWQCATSSAYASSATELVRAARAHEALREDDVAIRQYMEALTLDPTCEDAYLGLGHARERRGDLREAERVYDVALEHLPASRATRLARAYVRRSLGERAQAAADLERLAEADPSMLKIVARWYGEDGETPAQLAVWRTLASRAEAAGETALVRQARAMVRALVILVGPSDPAASPATSGAIRAFIAAIARAGGGAPPK